MVIAVVVGVITDKMFALPEGPPCRRYKEKTKTASSQAKWLARREGIASRIVHYCTAQCELANRSKIGLNDGFSGPNS